MARSRRPAEAAERLLEQTRRRLYQILADDESGEPDENDEQ